MKTLKKKNFAMRRLFICLSILLNFILIGLVSYNWYASKNRLEYFNFISSRFEAEKLKTDSVKKVCLVGNSITANWKNIRSDFFRETGFLNRGIGGNSSSQILLRFQQDVISTNPSIVVLNTGINDIANADGFYSEDFTIQNIQSIVDICKSRNITVLLASVLPVTEIQINRFKKIQNIQPKIRDLNIRIEKLSSDNGIKYIDYHSKLKNSDGTFNNNYNFDGVHPNEKGYKIMEKLLLETIKEIEQETNN